jgi:hypothetical protein
MNIIRLICRIITGLVFMFSGFVKAIDPLGSVYKFHDYFQAFHLDFLQVLSLPLALLMCTAEFITGFSVLTGLRYKTGLTGILILILFFTPLTLILAITNPVSDCGCFGDAIHISNWQTFGKNIILLVIIIILFTGRRNVAGILKAATEWTITGVVALIFIIFSISNLWYLPVIDFLPYSIGTNISAKMKVPENAQADQYSTTFIYEKNGRSEEFNINNYPSNDSTWKFVRQKSVLIKKGYEPPIHDFSITSPDSGDITRQILNNKGYTLLMISKKLNQAGQKLLRRGFELGMYCMSEGMSFYILTASGSDELKNLDGKLPFCMTDETVLKTMIRSNPGYILLRDGTITGKWSWTNVPGKEWFSNDMAGKQLEIMSKRNGLFLVIISLLSTGAILLLYIYIAREKRRISINPNR